MAEPIRILGFSGSLRAGSYNTMALDAAIALAPQGVEFRRAAIGHLPLYNDDLRLQGYPPEVEAFRQDVRWADAFLFVSPEYNFSVPGVLKNALDWGSRPPDQPFAGKAAAVMGASGGMLGTARMQYELRKIGVYLDLHFVNKPEVMIASAPQKFDAAGALTDESARALIAQLTTNLRDLTARLKATA